VGHVKNEWVKPLSLGSPLLSKAKLPLYAFNRGIVSRLALGRVDVDRLRLSAEEQTNWQPHIIGPMSLRPGLAFVGGTRVDSGTYIPSRFIPFIYGNADTASLELTHRTMRVWIPDGNGVLELISRPKVTTVVTNGPFAAAGGWTLKATDGCTAQISGGKLKLTATARGGKTSCEQTVQVIGANKGKEHALRIVVERGPVTFRVGTPGDFNHYIKTTKLGEGTHSLAFTPNGNFVIYFESKDRALRRVDSITIESDGTLEVPTPWATANLDDTRPAQSADIVYVACRNVQPYKIERRSTRSWSVVKYLPTKGPVKATASSDVKLEMADALEGNGRLIADDNFFTSDHEGTVIRLFTTGQTNECDLGAEDTFTQPIRITGNRQGYRQFRMTISGDWARNGATITAQSSMEEGDLAVGYTDVVPNKENNGDTWAVEWIKNTNPNKPVNFPGDVTPPELNTIVTYRFGFKEGEYKGGTAHIKFFGHKSVETQGARASYVRVTDVLSPRQANVEILYPASSYAKTNDWQESMWMADADFPTAVALHEGRLWWFGADRIWGSASDDYENFDIDKEGDAAPILRSIGYGPIDTINWALPLSRLILGREGSETSLRSSSLDEPLTPTNMSMKDCSTKGSAHIAAVKADTFGIFVSKNGKKVYELLPDGQVADYVAHDLTRLWAEAAGTGTFSRMCVAMQPDTCIHSVRSDGKVAVLLYDKEDEVEAWWLLETDGVVEECFSLPGEDDNDTVYYVVRRVINGLTKRYLERLISLTEITRKDARLADSHIVDTGGDRIITGLSHLEGETVVAWGWDNNADSGVHIETTSSGTVANNSGVVQGGRLILPVGTSYDNVCVGLPYTATFKSAKLAYAGDQGTALNQKKRVDHLGLILYDTHYQGLQYGQREDRLDNLPLVEDGATVAANTVHDEYDAPMIEVPGEWNTDSRLYLKASAPRPCTVGGAVIGMQTNG
jgi:hypothetical protein